MCKEEHAKRLIGPCSPVCKAVLTTTTAALAVALKEADTPEFKAYAQQVVRNARALADRLMIHGLNLVSGGTDNHLILIDLTNQGVSGKIAARALETAGIVCNATVSRSTRESHSTRARIRIGTPSMTSRGMGIDEMNRLADWIARSVKDRRHRHSRKHRSRRPRNV